VSGAAERQGARNAAARAGFLREHELLDARTVESMLASPAGELVDRGALLAVAADGQRLSPAWQFTADRLPRPVVGEVLKCLRSRGWSDWQVALWFDTPNGWLEDGARPVELLLSDPDAVSFAAHRDADSFPG
jgi:hypothetical protein